MKAQQINRIVNALYPYFSNYVLYAPYVVGEDKEFECYPVTEFKLSFLRRNQKFEVLIKTGSTKDAPLELKHLNRFLSSHYEHSPFNVLVGETNEDAAHVNSFVLSHHIGSIQHVITEIRSENINNAGNLICFHFVSSFCMNKSLSVGLQDRNCP